MEIKIFSVYDQKAEAYAQPFFMLTTGLAVRAFEASVQDPSTSFSKNPEDFTLFEIGIYDDAKGVIKTHETKINLGCAIEYLKKGNIQ